MSFFSRTCPISDIQYIEAEQALPVEKRRLQIFNRTTYSPQKPSPEFCRKILQTKNSPTPAIARPQETQRKETKNGRVAATQNKFRLPPRIDSQAQFIELDETEATQNNNHKKQSLSPMGTHKLNNLDTKIKTLKKPRVEVDSQTASILRKCFALVYSQAADQTKTTPLKQKLDMTRDSMRVKWQGR